MSTSFKIGVNAEERALLYLQNKGFILLEKRYKTAYGEIDLIMQDQNVIVAIEVKFRKNMEDCHYCLNQRQTKRIHDAFTYYLQQKEKSDSLLRCDVVLISPAKDIIHYENAW